MIIQSAEDKSDKNFNPLRSISEYFWKKPLKNEDF